MTRARILLADDHPTVRRTVVELLKSDFDVIGVVANGSEAIVEAKKLKPDIVVLDISMPILNGIQAANQLRASDSKSRVVFLTVQEAHEFIRAALAAGALGYVTKSRMATDLVAAIHDAVAGRQFISPALRFLDAGSSKAQQSADFSGEE